MRPTLLKFLKRFRFVTRDSLCIVPAMATATQTSPLEHAQAELDCANRRLHLAQKELRDFESEFTFCFVDSGGRPHPMYRCAGAAESEATLWRHEILRCEVDEAVGQLNLALQDFCETRRRAGLAPPSLADDKRGANRV